MTLCFFVGTCLLLLISFTAKDTGPSFKALETPSPKGEDDTAVITHSFKEDVLQDGTWRYEYWQEDVQSSLLILLLNHDESSWARSYPDYKHRHARDFFNLIETQVNLRSVSFGIMTASTSVYARLKRESVKRAVGHITILYKPDTTLYSYDDRHKDAIQYERRASIATLRNTLMSRALQDEEHIFWLDADVVGMSPNLIVKMVQQARANPKEVGAITARCQQADNINYDLNAWYIDRRVESIVSAVADPQRQASSDILSQTRRYIPDQIRGLGDDEMGRLDSVGGTSLLLNADLVRRGVNFPPYKIVGTTWTLDGWAAQETEGICYMAEKIDGSSCWVLGGSHHTRHAG